MSCKSVIKRLTLDFKAIQNLHAKTCLYLNNLIIEQTAAYKYIQLQNHVSVVCSDPKKYLDTPKNDCMPVR